MSEKGVIFDMDGVLVDSHEAHFQAFQAVGNRLGAVFTREMLEKTTGMHNRDIFPLWLGQALSPERIQELADEKERLYRARAESVLQGVAGSRELACALKLAGFRLAIGSSGPRLNVELAIRVLKLSSLFDAVVSGDDAPRGKPHPDIFLKAAQGIGLDPGRCVVIEDAPQGVRAALAAGMKVIAITTSNPSEALSHATKVVSSFQEISPETFKELCRGS